MSRGSKIYVKGLIALVIGGAGMRCGHELFMVFATLFAIGFGLICWSYTER